MSEIIKALEAGKTVELRSLDAKSGMLYSRRVSSLDKWTCVLQHMLGSVLNSAVRGVIEDGGVLRWSFGETHTWAETDVNPAISSTDVGEVPADRTVWNRGTDETLTLWSSPLLAELHAERAKIDALPAGAFAIRDARASAIAAEQQKTGPERSAADTSGDRMRDFVTALDDAMLSNMYDYLDGRWQKSETERVVSQYVVAELRHRARRRFMSDSDHVLIDRLRRRLEKYDTMHGEQKHEFDVMTRVLTDRYAAATKRADEWFADLELRDVANMQSGAWTKRLLDEIAAVEPATDEHKIARLVLEQQRVEYRRLTAQ